MTDRYLKGLPDFEAAAARQQRETDAMASMLGADSRRIDTLVGDVGEVPISGSSHYAACVFWRASP